MASIHSEHLETNVRHKKHVKPGTLNFNIIIVNDIKKEKVTAFLSMHTQIPRSIHYKVEINLKIHLEHSLKGAHYPATLYRQFKNQIT